MDVDLQSLKIFPNVSKFSSKSTEIDRSPLSVWGNDNKNKEEKFI